jgi:hypothetical protein
MNGVMGVMFEFGTTTSGFGPELYDVHLVTDGVETVARVRRGQPPHVWTEHLPYLPAEATATSRRSPYDTHVPIIGFALALGRALEKLGDGDEETLSIAFRALARTCAELGV